MSDKQIAIVTGGAGFLGSHVCDRLLASGAHVICIDNFFTGCRANIAHLLSNPEFELIEHDVIQPLPSAALGAVDRIYNLACPASPPHYQFDPIFTLKTSVLGALNMLELAERTGARILQASTSEVYGDPEVHPQPERYRGNVNPIGPRACYDEGKRAAETLFFDFNRERGVDTRVVRIFNTYGPRMHPFDGRVVSNFIRQALAGENLTVYGDGRQTRSFCYVDDLVDGLIRMMEATPENVHSRTTREEISPESRLFGPVNLGNPEQFTIADFARLVLELTASSAGIQAFPAPEDDPVQRQPDIARARELLDWSPTVAAHEGVKRTIEWFRSIDISRYSPPTAAKGPKWAGGA